ncbi:hypothetical protein AG1IA_09430 [Rhizoctonia solani AG-1 IA]|uniref:Uncharacterized protein n=1 Tax=Thanatephorus cucumeris (strain AG1-IA) TaxID=983506 RepID=L8WIB4_THACA|nr:hypothetical protein AG1IA_09430 [Rhizoctonia solani AG-1 IA]
MATVHFSFILLHQRQSEWLEPRIHLDVFATKPAETQNRDLAGACSESRDYFLGIHKRDCFILCRLASDFLHCLASHTPSAAAHLYVFFFNPAHHPIRLREVVWAPPPREPVSRSGAPGPPSLLCIRGGSPNFTSLGLVAYADE